MQIQVKTLLQTGAPYSVLKVLLTPNNELVQQLTSTFFVVQKTNETVLSDRNFFKKSLPELSEADLTLLVT